jgi:hypothetical protein
MSSQEKSNTGKNAVTDEPRWLMVYRPRKSPRYAMIAASVVILVHVVIALLLHVGDTGVDFQVADQIAMVGLGVIIGGSFMLIARARIRIGAEGVAVRNLFNERIFDWSIIMGIRYPRSGSWARLELPEDEHVPILAIQANDGERAVAAMAQVRTLHDRFGAHD